MRSRYKTGEDCNTYFITSSTYCFVPIFFNEDIFQILINSLKYCMDHKGMYLYAYVFMLNHIHAIIGHEDAKEIPNIVRDFKRHTSKEITQYLGSLGDYSNLFWIKLFKDRGGIWQPGYHPEGIFSEEMFNVKINYSHNNPVEKGYVEKPEDWKYSSARNYILDDDLIVKLTEF